MENHPFKGFFAAPYTPFNAQGELQLVHIPAYAKKLKSAGVKGVFVGGTTGEGVSLSLEERMLLTEAWLATQTDDFKIWTHVGHECLSVARRLAVHAQMSGVDAIGTMGPSFWKVKDVKVLAEYCAEIAAAAPELDFYYYHIPSMTGVQLSIYDFLQIARNLIPKLKGVKFTHSDFYDMQRCVQLDKHRFEILNGFDEMLLAGLSMGANGAVGSTYNYMAPLFRQIRQFWVAGELEKARKLQFFTTQVVDICKRFRGSTVAGKGIMKLCGIDCGPNRLPLKTLSDAELLSLEKELHSIRFFETIDAYY